MLLGVVGASAAPPPGFFDTSSLAARHQHHASRLHRIARANLAPAPMDGVIRPTDYGADATGALDASDALDRAVAALCALGGGAKTPQKLVNLGGATIDLSGGVYSLSRTLRVPNGYANYRIERGTLRAGAGFGAAAYMLQIGDEQNCSKSALCASNIGIEQLTLEGGQRAFGGILVAYSMDNNIGPAIFATGFTGVGISLAGSGAGYIHEAWLGQYPAGDKTPRENATATAILLAGGEHDCDLNNVIIFSGRVGVNSTNGANRLQGVHTWNLAGAQGGVGIVLHNGAGRVEQSYLDYAPLVIRGHADGGASSKPALVEGNWFLGSSTIVLEAPSKRSAISSLIVTGNTFSSWDRVNSTVTLDESHGAFAAVYDAVWENNEVAPELAGLKRSLRATKSVAIAAGATRARLAFDDALIFGGAVGIDPDSLRCDLHGGWAAALSANASANDVDVVLANPCPSPCPARVTCTVDQARRTCAAH